MNNVVRVTVQALAAVLGGTQSLHTNAYDEALALPTEESARLALRTQQLVAHESGVPLTADPLGGSHYVEELTDEIERRVKILLDEIEELGGASKAIDRGFFQKAIAKSAYVFQREVESGDRVVVGVNHFTDEEDPTIIPSPNYSALADRQVERLQEARRNRDESSWRKSLDELAKAAGSTESEPLMPFIIRAVSARATVGEISNALREVWGTYQPAG